MRWSAIAIVAFTACEQPAAQPPFTAHGTDTTDDSAATAYRSAPIEQTSAALPVSNAAIRNENQEDPGSASLPGADSLSPLRVFGDTAAFGRISSVRVSGDRIWITDRFMSPHVSVLDRSDGRLIRNFGREGEGPGEFRDPTVVEVYDDHRALLYDFQVRRLTHVDIRTDELVVDQLTLDFGMSLLDPVVTDSVIVTNGLFPDHSLAIVDRSDHTFRRIAGRPPHALEDVKLRVAARLMNRSYVTANPDQTRLALGYQFAPRVDFFTVGGQHYASTPAPRDLDIRWHNEDDRFFWDDGSESAYTAIAADDRYVYALFCRCRLGDDSPPPPLLHIYRWDGTFVGEWVFATQVREIAVDPLDPGYIIGVVEDPYPRLAEFRSPIARAPRSTSRADTPKPAARPPPARPAPPSPPPRPAD